MTKQEAIDNLNRLRDEVWNEDSDGYEYAKAIDTAIEALEVGHAQCNDCHYLYHWMTQRMNGQNGGASA